jgi:hypothetical protein
MAKQKKKRNKSYTGVDAAITRPVITHISAANRSKLSQWWFERKATLKPILIIIGIVVFIIIIVAEIIHISSGGAI